MIQKNQRLIFTTTAPFINNLFFIIMQIKDILHLFQKYIGNAPGSWHTPHDMYMYKSQNWLWFFFTFMSHIGFILFKPGMNYYGLVSETVPKYYIVACQACPALVKASIVISI